MKLIYSKAPFGSQANIRSVKMDLPKQLPSRLTTLQKACTAAQFKANRAGCPAASIVHAKAITPLVQQTGRISSRFETRRSSRSKTLNYIFSVGNARRSPHPPTAARTRPKRRSRRGRATRPSNHP
jgi:hypothetical protein